MLRKAFAILLFVLCVLTIARETSRAQLPAVNSTQAVSIAALQSGVLYSCLTGANMNSTADQAMVLPFPTSFTRFRVGTIIASNPSTSLAASAAAGGIYTAASKGGTAIVAAAQTYTALTTNSANTTGSMLVLTVVNQNTAFYQPAAASTIYFSLTTGHGSAATLDLCFTYNPLP